MFMVHDTVIFNTKLILFMHGIKYLYYFNFTHLIIFNTKFFIFPASNYNIYCHYHKYRINRSTVYTFLKLFKVTLVYLDTQYLDHIHFYLQRASVLPFHTVHTQGTIYHCKKYVTI